MSKSCALHFLPSVKKQKHDFWVCFFADQPSASAYNPYLDFVYFGYQKNLIQILFNASRS